MAVPFYIIEVSCDAIEAQVSLNGVPLIRHKQIEGKFIGTKLNPWMVEGENLLEVKLASLVPGEEDPTSGFTLQLFVGSEGQELTDDDVRLVYRWSHAESPLPAAGEPSPRRVFRHMLRLPKAFGRWGWEDAPPFQPADRNDVLNLLHELHGVLSRGDMAAFLALLRPKHEEFGRAIGRTADVLEEQTRKLYDKYYFNSDKPFELMAIEDDDIRMEPFAAGRLVELQHASWPHPIIGRSDYRFSFDVTVSKVKDRWQIVR